MALSSRPQALPRTIGPYRLEALLGEGGMGEVYRAYDERLRRDVAIKNIRAEDAEKANLRHRFRREARTVARLNHAAIVRIYDILETEEGDWIVMELVEGRTLRTVLEQDELALEQRLRLAREIAGGLAVAHDQRIIHRDLKPENVMVTKKGHAKILDFGLAKELKKRDPNDTTLSSAGMVLGTFRAMSPEQIMEDEIDSRSDLFSFGTLVYEMLTGESPFRAPNIVSTMTRVCRHLQPPASSLNSEIPQELSDFIDRLLEKKPGRRPQSALDAVHFFDRLTGETSVLPPLDFLREGTPRPAAPNASTTSADPTEPIKTEPATKLASGSAHVTRHKEKVQSGIVIRTLLATEIVRRRDLVERLGEPGAADALARLRKAVEELLTEYVGKVREEDDDLLIVFERPSTAVEFALAYHRRAARLAHELDAPLNLHTGIHLGEILLEPADPLEEELTIHSRPALSADDRGAQASEDPTTEIERFGPFATRSLMTLARPNQILMTEAVDELVKRSSVARHFGEQELSWKSYGEYLLPGTEENPEIFQVGFTGQDLFMAPDPPTQAYEPSVEPPRRSPRPFLLWGLVALVLILGFLLLR